MADEPTTDVGENGKRERSRDSGAMALRFLKEARRGGKNGDSDSIEARQLLVAQANVHALLNLADVIREANRS
jgi:hypothetical protein